MFNPEFMRIFIVALILFVPTLLIYRKAGFHPTWALLLLLPGFGLLLIFLQLAFVPWPNQKDRKKAS